MAEPGKDSLELSESGVAQALKTGQRWIVWQSDDEGACQQELQALASQGELELRYWSLEQDEHAYVAFDQALGEVLQSGVKSGRHLWVWLDYDPPAALAPRLTRKLRRIAQRDLGLACVFVQYFDAAGQGPPERFVLRRPTPGLDDLIHHITQRCLQGSAELGLGLPPEDCDRLYEQRQALASACVGLQTWQVDIALRRAASFSSADQPTAAIQAYKAQALNAAQMLEPSRALPSRELGGLGEYKSWLQEQKVAMEPQAQALGVKAPRGALLVGVPGCGKSLAARVTADELGLPLYRLDLGRLFTGILGESEARMRQTLALCERLAPAVLWIDEIEKGLSSGTGHSDGGTAQRSLATLMTWLQEHQSPLFLVATANRIEALPPELLRQGRLDDTFFVDLPSPQERLEVLQVYGVQQWPADTPTQDQAITRSEGYSGAELCACVSRARLLAYMQSRPPQWSDLVQAIEATIPLSRARKSQIQTLRQWGQNHARPAQRALTPQS